MEFTAILRKSSNYLPLLAPRARQLQLFAYQILSQSHRPALLSTMNTTLDGETFFKSTLTTPESLDLIKMMAQALANGRTHLIMEVSSQAYLKKRVYGLTFDVGVFLNISPDHIGPIESIQPLKITSTINGS